MSKQVGSVWESIPHEVVMKYRKASSRNRQDYISIPNNAAVINWGAQPGISVTHQQYATTYGGTYLNVNPNISLRGIDAPRALAAMNSYGNAPLVPTNLVGGPNTARRVGNQDYWTSYQVDTTAPF